MEAVRILRALVSSILPAAAILLAMTAAVPDAFAGPGDCKRKGRRSIGCTVGANQPPTINGTPPAQATAGQAYSFTPSATDPEGQSLSFSIANKPPWASFSASTGRLTGTPSATDLGEHADISIQVSDGRLTSTLGPFYIVVNSGNQAPSIAGA
ncbi:MAG TPA: putative Ig domain-containing protein, partial [Candidatus Polarisedimenticolaceae bacterium]|nr:putative Ig domain-containing protein [Candidatus Polarisedimenticolaceae bacterium]